MKALKKPAIHSELLIKKAILQAPFILNLGLVFLKGETKVSSSFHIVQSVNYIYCKKTLVKVEKCFYLLV